MRQGEVHTLKFFLFGAFLEIAVQLHMGFAQFIRVDFDILSAHALTQSCSQRFEKRFFGREAGGITGK